MDDLPIPKVSDFENRLYEELDSRYADWVKQLDREKAMTDEVQNGLDKLLAEMKERFQTEQ